MHETGQRIGLSGIQSNCDGGWVVFAVALVMKTTCPRLGTAYIGWTTIESSVWRSHTPKIGKPGEELQMLTVYGLKSCDTTRKTLKWLERREVAHRFLDVRADGVDIDKLTEWAMEVGWEALLNRGSTTWRGLDEVIRENVTEDTALQLMVENPALIKRPVIETDAGVLVGWKTEQQRTLEELL